MGRDTLVNICLVYDLGYQLWPLADGTRVGSRKFGARNLILAASDDEQAEQGPDVVNSETQKDYGADQKYGDASAHIGGWIRQWMHLRSVPL